MGRKPQSIIQYQGKDLATTIDQKHYKVTFDKHQGAKGSYRLWCDSKKICSKVTLDEIAAEFYSKVQTNNPVAIKSYEMQSKKVPIKVIWVNVFKKDKLVQDFLFEFYDEQNLLVTDEGEEPFTMEQLCELCDSQAAPQWMAFLDAKEILKEKPDYEPCFQQRLFGFKGNELYIINNKKENRSDLLIAICKYQTDIINMVNNLSKDELKQSLLAAGTVVVDKFKKKECLMYDAHVISEEELESYYTPNWTYETDGEKVIKTQKLVTKEYIIREFAKLLKANKEEIAAIAGIPELTKLNDIPEK